MKKFNPSFSIGVKTPTYYKILALLLCLSFVLQPIISIRSPQLPSTKYSFFYSDFEDREGWKGAFEVKNSKISVDYDQYAVSPVISLQWLGMKDLYLATELVGGSENNGYISIWDYNQSVKLVSISVEALKNSSHIDIFEYITPLTNYIQIQLVGKISLDSLRIYTNNLYLIDYLAEEESVNTQDYPLVVTPSDIEALYPFARAFPVLTGMKKSFTTLTHYLPFVHYPTLTGLIRIEPSKGEETNCLYSVIAVNINVVVFNYHLPPTTYNLVSEQLDLSSPILPISVDLSSYVLHDFYLQVEFQYLNVTGGTIITYLDELVVTNSYQTDPLNGIVYAQDYLKTFNGNIVNVDDDYPVAMKQSTTGKMASYLVDTSQGNFSYTFNSPDALLNFTTSNIDDVNSWTVSSQGLETRGPGYILERYSALTEFDVSATLKLGTGKAGIILKGDYYTSTKFGIEYTSEGYIAYLDDGGIIKSAHVEKAKGTALALRIYTSNEGKTFHYFVDREEVFVLSHQRIKVQAGLFAENGDMDNDDLLATFWQFDAKCFSETYASRIILRARASVETTLAVYALTVNAYSANIYYRKVGEITIPSSADFEYYILPIRTISTRTPLTFSIEDIEGEFYLSSFIISGAHDFNEHFPAYDYYRASSYTSIKNQYCIWYPQEGEVYNTPQFVASYDIYLKEGYIGVRAALLESNAQLILNVLTRPLGSDNGFEYMGQIKFVETDNEIHQHWTYANVSEGYYEVMFETETYKPIKLESIFTAPLSAYVKAEDYIDAPNSIGWSETFSPKRDDDQTTIDTFSKNVVWSDTPLGSNTAEWVDPFTESLFSSPFELENLNVEQTVFTGSEVHVYTDEYFMLRYPLSVTERTNFTLQVVFTPEKWMLGMTISLADITYLFGVENTTLKIINFYHPEIVYFTHSLEFQPTAIYIEATDVISFYYSNFDSYIKLTELNISHDSVIDVGLGGIPFAFSKSIFTDFQLKYGLNDNFNNITKTEEYFNSAGVLTPYFTQDSQGLELTFTSIPYDNYTYGLIYSLPFQRINSTGTLLSRWETEIYLSPSHESGFIISNTTATGEDFLLLLTVGIHNGNVSTSFVTRNGIIYPYYTNLTQDALFSAFSQPRIKLRLDCLQYTDGNYEYVFSYFDPFANTWNSTFDFAVTPYLQVGIGGTVSINSTVGYDTSRFSYLELHTYVNASISRIDYLNTSSIFDEYEFYNIDYFNASDSQLSVYSSDYAAFYLNNPRNYLNETFMDISWSATFVLDPVAQLGLYVRGISDEYFFSSWKNETHVFVSLYDTFDITTPALITLSFPLENISLISLFAQYYHQTHELQFYYLYTSSVELFYTLSTDLFEFGISATVDTRQKYIARFENFAYVSFLSNLLSVSSFVTYQQQMYDVSTNDTELEWALSGQEFVVYSSDTFSFHASIFTLLKDFDGFIVDVGFLSPIINSGLFFTNDTYRYALIITGLTTLSLINADTGVLLVNYSLPYSLSEFSLRLRATTYTSLEVITEDEVIVLDNLTCASWSKVGFLGFNPSHRLKEYRFDYFAVSSLFYDQALNCYVNHAPVLTRGDFVGESISYDYGVFLKGSLDYSVNTSVLPTVENSAQFLYFEAWGLRSQLSVYNISLTLTFNDNFTYTYTYTVQNSSFTPYHVNLYRHSSLTTLLTLEFSLPHFTLLRNVQLYSICGWYPEPTDNKDSYADVASNFAIHQEINSLHAGEYIIRPLSPIDLQMLNLTFQFSEEIISVNENWEFPLLSLAFGTTKIDLVWWEYNNSFYNTMAIKYANDTLHPSGNPTINPLAQYTRYSFQTTNETWLTVPHTIQLKFDWSKLTIDGLLDGEYYCSLQFTEYLQGNIPSLTLTLQGPPLSTNADLIIHELLFNNIDAPVAGWIGTADITMTSWFSSFKGEYLLLSNIKLLSRQSFTLTTLEATLTGYPLTISIDDFSSSYSLGTLSLPEEKEGSLTLYSLKQTLLSNIILSRRSSSTVFIEEFSNWHNEDIEVSTLGTDRIYGGVLRLNPGNTSYTYLFAPEEHDYYHLHDFLIQIRFVYNLTAINTTANVDSKAAIVFEFYDQDEIQQLEIGMRLSLKTNDIPYLTPYYRTFYCSQWSDDTLFASNIKYFGTGNITLLISGRYDNLSGQYVFTTYINNTFSQFTWWCNQPSNLQFGVSLHGTYNQGVIGIDRVEYQELGAYEPNTLTSLTDKPLYTSMGHLVLRENEIVEANMVIDAYSSFSMMFTPIFGDFEFGINSTNSESIRIVIDDGHFAFNIYGTDGTWISQRVYDRVLYGETYILTVVHQGLSLDFYLYPLLDDLPETPSFQFSTKITNTYTPFIETFSHALLFVKQVDNGHTTIRPTETVENLKPLRSGGNLPTYVLQGTVNKVLSMGDNAFASYSFLLSEDLEVVSLRLYRLNDSEDTIIVRSGNTDVYTITINDTVISVYSPFTTNGVMYANYSNLLYTETWYELRVTNSFSVDDVGNRIITYHLFINDFELKQWIQREDSENALPFKYNTWVSLHINHAGLTTYFDDVNIIESYSFDDLQGWTISEHCTVVRDPAHNTARLEILGGVVWGDAVVNLYVDDVWVARDVWKLKGYGGIAGHEVHSFILPDNIDISIPHRYTLKSTGIIEILSLLVTESVSIDTWLATSQPVNSSYVPLFPEEYFAGYDPQVGNITLVNTDIHLSGNAKSTSIRDYNSYRFQDLDNHDNAHFPTIDFFAKGENGRISLHALMKNYLTGNEYVPVNINLVFNGEQDTTITEKWDKKVTQLIIADINTDVYYYGGAKHRVVPVLSYSYWQYLQQFLTYEYSEELQQYVYTFTSPHDLPDYQLYQTIIGDGFGQGLYLLDTVYGLNDEWRAVEDFHYENDYGTTLSQGALSEPIETYFLESVTVTYSLPRLSSSWKYYRVNLDEIINKIKGSPIEIPTSIPDYTYTTEKVLSGIYVAVDKSTRQTIDLRNQDFDDMLHELTFDKLYLLYYGSIQDPVDLSPAFSDLFINEKFRFYSYNRTVDCTTHNIYIYSYSVDKYAPSNSNDFISLTDVNNTFNQYEMTLSSDSSFLISSINGKTTKLDIGGFPSENITVSASDLTSKWIKVGSNFSNTPVNLDDFIARPSYDSYSYEYASTYLYATAEVFSTISLSTSYPVYVYLDNTLVGSIHQYYGGNITIPLILSKGKHTLNMMFIIEPSRSDPIFYHAELTAPNTLLPSINDEKSTLINKWIRGSLPQNLWLNNKTEIMYALTKGLPLDGDWYSIRSTDDSEEVFISFEHREYEEHSINDSLIKENLGDKVAYVSYMYFSQPASNILEISLSDIVDENNTHLSGAVIEEMYYDDICLVSEGQPMVEGFSQFGGNLTLASDVVFSRTKHILGEYGTFHAATNSIGFHQLTIVFNVTTLDSTLDVNVEFHGVQTDAIATFNLPQLVIHNFRKTLVNREVYYTQLSLTSSMSLYKPLRTEFDVIYGRWEWLEGSLVPIRDKFVTLVNPTPVDAEQKYIRAVLILDHSLAESSEYEQHRLGQFLIVFENSSFVSGSSSHSSPHMLVEPDEAILSKNLDAIFPVDYTSLLFSGMNSSVSIKHSVQYIHDGELEEGLRTFTNLGGDLEIQQVFSSLAPIGSTFVNANISRVRTIRVQDRFTLEWSNVPYTSDLFTTLCVYIENLNSSSAFSYLQNWGYNKIEYTFDTNNVLSISSSLVEYLTTSNQVMGFTLDGDFYSYNRSLPYYQYYESSKQGLGILLSLPTDNSNYDITNQDPIFYQLMPGIDYGGYNGFNGIFTNQPVNDKKEEDNSLFDNWLSRKLNQWLVDSLDKLGKYLSRQIEKIFGERTARFFRILGTVARTVFQLFITGFSAILYTVANIAYTMVKLLDLVSGVHLPSNMELNSGKFDERFYTYKLELVKFLYTLLHTLLFGTDIGFMMPKSKAFERSEETKSLMSPDWVVDAVVQKYNALVDYHYEKTTGIRLFTYENSTEASLAGTDQDPTYLRWLNVSKYIAPFGKVCVLNYDSYHDEYGDVLPWKVPRFEDGYLAIILQEKDDNGDLNWNIYMSLDKKMKLPFIPPLITDLGMATEDVMMIFEIILNANPYLAFIYDIRDALLDPYPIARWISITQIPGDIRAIITHIRATPGMKLLDSLKKGEKNVNEAILNMSKRERKSLEYLQKNRMTKYFDDQVLSNDKRFYALNKYLKDTAVVTPGKLWQKVVSKTGRATLSGLLFVGFFLSIFLYQVGMQKGSIWCVFQGAKWAMKLFSRIWAVSIRLKGEQNLEHYLQTHLDTLDSGTIIEDTFTKFFVESVQNEEGKLTEIKTSDDELLSVNVEKMLSVLKLFEHELRFSPNNEVFSSKLLSGISARTTSKILDFSALKNLPATQRNIIASLIVAVSFHYLLNQDSMIANDFTKMLYGLIEKVGSAIKYKSDFISYKEFGSIFSELQKDYKNISTYTLKGFFSNIMGFFGAAIRHVLRPNVEKLDSENPIRKMIQAYALDKLRYISGDFEAGILQYAFDNLGERLIDGDTIIHGQIEGKTSTKTDQYYDNGVDGYTSTLDMLIKSAHKKLSSNFKLANNKYNYNSILLNIDPLAKIPSVEGKGWDGIKRWYNKFYYIYRLQQLYENLLQRFGTNSYILDRISLLKSMRTKTYWIEQYYLTKLECIQQTLTSIKMEMFDLLNLPKDPFNPNPNSERLFKNENEIPEQLKVLTLLEENDQNGEITYKETTKVLLPYIIVKQNGIEAKIPVIVASPVPEGKLYRGVSSYYSYFLLADLRQYEDNDIKGLRAMGKINNDICKYSMFTLEELKENFRVNSLEYEEGIPLTYGNDVSLHFLHGNQKYSFASINDLSKVTNEDTVILTLEFYVKDEKRYVSIEVPIDVMLNGISINSLKSLLIPKLNEMGFNTDEIQHIVDQTLKTYGVKDNLIFNLKSISPYTFTMLSLTPPNDFADINKEVPLDDIAYYLRFTAVTSNNKELLITIKDRKINLLSTPSTGARIKSAQNLDDLIHTYDDNTKQFFEDYKTILKNLKGTTAYRDSDGQISYINYNMLLTLWKSGGVSLDSTKGYIIDFKNYLASVLGNAINANVAFGDPRVGFATFHRDIFSLIRSGKLTYLTTSPSKLSPDCIIISKDSMLRDQNEYSTLFKNLFVFLSYNDGYQLTKVFETEISSNYIENYGAIATYGMVDPGATYETPYGGYIFGDNPDLIVVKPYLDTYKKSSFMSLQLIIGGAYALIHQDSELLSKIMRQMSKMYPLYSRGTPKINFSSKETIDSLQILSPQFAKKMYGLLPESVTKQGIRDLSSMSHKQRTILTLKYLIRNLTVKTPDLDFKDILKNTYIHKIQGLYLEYIKSEDQFTVNVKTGKESRDKTVRTKNDLLKVSLFIADSADAILTNPNQHVDQVLSHKNYELIALDPRTGKIVLNAQLFQQLYMKIKNNEQLNKYEQSLMNTKVMQLILTTWKKIDTYAKRNVKDEKILIYQSIFEPKRADQWIAILGNRGKSSKSFVYIALTSDFFKRFSQDDIREFNKALLNYEETLRINRNTSLFTIVIPISKSGNQPIYIGSLSIKTWIKTYLQSIGYIIQNSERKGRTLWCDATSQDELIRVWSDLVELLATAKKKHITIKLPDDEGRSPQIPVIIQNNNGKQKNIRVNNLLLYAGSETEHGYEIGSYRYHVSNLFDNENKRIPYITQSHLAFVRKDNRFVVKLISKYDLLAPKYLTSGEKHSLNRIISAYQYLNEHLLLFDDLSIVLPNVARILSGKPPSSEVPPVRIDQFFNSQ